jgi:hypothetical protein
MSLLKKTPEEQHPQRMPVPTQYEVGSGKASDGKSYVVLELRFNNGEITVFMEPDFAEEFGSRVVKQAVAAGNIVVATPEQLKAIEDGLRRQGGEGQ